MSIDFKRIESHDRRLGRHVYHDDRSRGFPAQVQVDTSTWRTRSVRIYDPLPNPNQAIGNCTTCAESMLCNTQGNRKAGVVLNMTVADSLYRWATANDPFVGTWEPDDTGSNGLSAWKAARAAGYAGRATWLFGGADQIVQAVVNGNTVSIGTVWKNGMFDPNSKGVIEPTGGVAGGHQYVARRYDEYRDLVGIRCWWGDYRDVWIKREHLNDLVMDDGDAHLTERV